MKHISLFAVLLLYAGFVHAQMLTPAADNPLRLRDSALYLPIRLVPQDSYSKELAFFCKRMGVGEENRGSYEIPIGKRRLCKYPRRKKPTYAIAATFCSSTQRSEKRSP